MGKRTDSLLFRFTLSFALFALVALFMGGIITYVQQNRIFKAQKEDSLQSVASYLSKRLASEGEEYVYFQQYFINHFEDMQLPVDFSYSDELNSKIKFETLFNAEYAGKKLGIDVAFNDMSEKVKEAFAIWKYEKYLLMFEEAKEDFGMIYAYSVLPTAKDDSLEIFYITDDVREKRESDGFFYLGAQVEHPLIEHRCMWEAWKTGKKATGYDIYNNNYGKTYAYYTPLVINGQKTCVIGVEVEIANVNKAILKNSLRQMAYVGGTLILLVIALLFYIYKRYIAKLEHIKANVKAYTQNKDPSFADNIGREATGDDEISVLALQVSSMILELENYMKSLLETAKELRDTQQKAEVMNELAMKDALTGIRNKTSYDQEVKKLEWKMGGDENLQFAIAMIDLNYLKRLNDTFGHDKGNIAIKKLCYIVCHIFEHSPVFRIGGDEFVVILLGEDFERRDTLCSIFNSKLEEIKENTDLEPWEKVSASIGIAVYDKSIDSNVDNVFKRADKEMYQRKKEMKANRTI